MVYKPLAVRVALVAGFRRALPGLQIDDSRRRSRGNVGIPQRFPRSVGRVESRLLGFPSFHTPAFPWLGRAETALSSLLRTSHQASNPAQAQISTTRINAYSSRIALTGLVCMARRAGR